jgi:hypothetical protein
MHSGLMPALTSDFDRKKMHSGLMPALMHIIFDQ